MSVATTSPFRARTGSELAADQETSREQLPARASPSRHNERTRAIGGSGRFCGPVEGIAAALMRRCDALFAALCVQGVLVWTGAQRYFQL